MVALIAVLNKRGEDATQTAIKMLKTLKLKEAKTFGIASPTAVRIGKTIETLQDSKLGAPVMIGSVFSKTLTADSPQPLKLKDATLVFEGEIHPTVTGESDVEAFIRKAEGGFALAGAKTDTIIAGRDVLGIYPFYYGENADWIALASVRRALWGIGIEKAISFPPGYISIITKLGFKFKPVKTFIRSKPKPITMQAAVRRLHMLLQNSIMKKVSGVKEVALPFSGGLDSSVIAILAKSSGTSVHLIHVSLANQLETEHAEKAAKELDLPIHVEIYDEEDVERDLPKVLWLIEESNPVKTSIGIPIYWAAEKAAEMNIKVMVAGQGADELFGGYKRHVDTYLRHGSEKAQEAIFKDITGMYEANFERDVKICSYHGEDLRLPFATYEMVRFAIGLPVDLKMEQSTNTLRKLILRQLARDLGLPKFVAEKPKKAIQYTTGTSKALRKLAKRNGLTVNDYLDKIFQIAIKDDAK